MFQRLPDFVILQLFILGQNRALFLYCLLCFIRLRYSLPYSRWWKSFTLMCVTEVINTLCLSLRNAAVKSLSFVSRSSTHPSLSGNKECIWNWSVQRPFINFKFHRLWFIWSAIHYIYLIEYFSIHDLQRTAHYPHPLALSCLLLHLLEE